MAKIAFGFIESPYISKVGDELEPDGFQVVEIPDQLWAEYRTAEAAQHELLMKITAYRNC